MSHPTVEGSLLPQEIPSNTYSLKNPWKAKLIENTKLTAEGSPNDVRHLVFDLSGSAYQYLEGQSAGVIPPGEDANGKSHKLRLYSIASPAVGDDGQGKTVTLCVKRLVYTDEATGEEKKGVCSNYLCDLPVGSEVDMTGPVGKAFLMPPSPNANIIMIGTGTGIAPFRGFLHNRYHARAGETGESWLFFGVQTRKDYLYEKELEAYKTHDTYHLVTAFSREEQTADGKRMYVQHRILEHGDRIFELAQQPNTYMYICGLKGMETGILESLATVGERVGLPWETLLAQMKADKRYHIEVY